MHTKFELLPRERALTILTAHCLGDALGAPHEGGPLERLVWAIVGRTPRGKRRYSDDTRMSLDILESVARHGTLDASDVAQTFAASYHWSRGYGPGAAKILKRIRHGMPAAEAARSVYPEGSWGNGAAMRAHVLGIFLDGAALEAAVVDVSGITHAHPTGIDGARVVANVVRRVAEGKDAIDAALDAVQTSQLGKKIELIKSLGDSDSVRTRCGSGVAATESVPAALWLADHYRDRDFLDLLKGAIALRGDVDSVSAMAGAIWGARADIEALPSSQIRRIEGPEALRHAYDAAVQSIENGHSP